MESKGTILVVDDEKDLADLLSKRLKFVGYDVISVTSGRDALAKVKDLLPDLIILDVMMPEMNGMEVKARLNQDETTAQIPVIFLTAKSSIEDKVAGFRLRGDDYVVKPYDTAELMARIEVTIARKKNYEILSMRDGLTGLANAPYFNKQLEIYFAMAKRYQRNFSVVMLDIDDFKKINDTYGHHAGDQVIRGVAEKIKSTLRAVDIPARYGGDEFAIILQENDEAQAACALSRLKSSIEGTSLTIDTKGKTIAVSISAGIATYDSRFVTEVEIFELADKRMYLDKQAKKKSCSN